MTLAGSVDVARATDSVQAAPSDTADAQAFEQARALHKRATTKYATADFDAAIELWTEAYERIEGHPRANEIRHAMSYNLASAHLEQFAVDRDAQHLGRARVLLERYLTILGPSTDENAAEHDRVGQSLERIAALQKDAVADDREATSPAVDPAARAEAPQQDVRGPVRPSRPLLVAGGVLSGVGLGLGAGMVVGMVRGKAAQRDTDDPERPAAELGDLQARGEASNRIAIGTGVAAGTLAIAGAVLLGLGIARHKRRRSATTARIPMPVVHMGGLSWHF